ncbi:two-component system, NtrC family, response regulator [Desulfonauticus submarinus]|uniref:Two-component system, NtrC family, response regulator n=1 Tax=Desulfonauticus submarinus TaxID=206665 RepID=A0A1H0F0Z7_9BACT|nr:sigma-54 dependent transcriptional regulator [Desulfonauticus submarinus]SDN88243.1 two-component system, NtrC family, response regulator [Desulfonauticus submarinus]
MKGHVLVIDDEKNYLLLLEALLNEEGIEVTGLSDPEMALDFLEESEVDVVVTDMKMPRLSGQDILEKVKKDFPHIPVIIMTAFGSIDGAVEAMRCGAFDYLTKPFSNEELILVVKRALNFAHMEQENVFLKESLVQKYAKKHVIGKSKKIQTVLHLLEKVAPSKSTVLILGESGTGKELIARALHYSSPRSKGPFVAINCMALNPALLESELFGHEKGSFTGAVATKKGKFELASGGTLFLDEIGELSPEIQVKLLRVLQERKIERVGGTKSIPVDIRLVCATNKNLKQEVEKGNFREDLYYRLNVVEIELPPLRERKEDIPLLVAYFVNKICEQNSLPLKHFTPEALEYLSLYDWPGNVRQLENVVERCVVLSSSEQIGVEDLPSEVKDEETQLKSAVDLLPLRLNLAETLEKIEEALIKRALVKSNFVQVKAAEMLGISKSLLQYKIKKYNISF